MREYVRAGGTLSKLPLPSKALYVGFLGLTVSAFVTSFLLYYKALGLTSAEAATHYLGNEHLPDAETLILQKSYVDLLEITHFHLYTQPVLLLVLGHLFLLARGGAWKFGVILAAVGITVLHIAGPWIIWFGGAAFGPIMPLSGVAFLAIYLFLAIWPLPDLLSPTPKRQA
jgi:hypothetical protein